MGMRIRPDILMVIGGFAVVIFIFGCAPTGRVAATDEQTHAYTEGMVCPKCETVWVTDRNRRGPRKITRLSYSREMTCPDCEKMARSQLLGDGEVILHECPTCKIAPWPIKTREVMPDCEPY